MLDLLAHMFSEYMKFLNGDLKVTLEICFHAFSKSIHAFSFRFYTFLMFITGKKLNVDHDI